MPAVNDEWNEGVRNKSGSRDGVLIGAESKGKFVRFEWEEEEVHRRADMCPEMAFFIARQILKACASAEGYRICQQCGYPNPVEEVKLKCRRCIDGYVPWSGLAKMVVEDVLGIESDHNADVKPSQRN